ncbi:hypothetical protein SEA_MURP_7 [Gordonia phage Murp]|nr:hypothetical protein SEA_MURP_7 [Gordonia phage Murp]UVK58946.1 hypothetical protein SEA_KAPPAFARMDELTA_7 [Gordonia phage KappaFarmDelta]
MTEFVLTASRFDQVVKRDDKGFPLKVVRHRRGDLVSDLPDAEVARLLAAGAIRPAPDPDDEDDEVTVVVPADADATVVVAEAQAAAVDAGDADAQAAETELIEAQVAAAQTVSELNTQLAEPVRPKITATKKVWVEYAVARGWKAEKAEELDKQELIEALA